MEEKIYNILRKHNLPLKKREALMVDLLDLFSVSKRFSEMEEAGKEAISLIAHLKDQYGFNEAEEEAQDKIMAVFEYEGRW